MNKKDDYKFTKEELEEITNIISQKSVTEAERKFCFKENQFLSLRKTDAKLDAAIKKGQEMRHRLQNKQLYKELDRFSNFSQKELKKIKQIASQKAGIKAIQSKYEISSRMLDSLRKKSLNLAKAINEGLYLRKQKSQEGKDNNTNNKSAVKNNFKSVKVEKKKLEYQSEYKIEQKNVYDNPDTALEKYRKLVKERKLRETINQIKNGEFRNMVGD